MPDGAFPSVDWNIRRAVDVLPGLCVDILDVRAATVLSALEATREVWAGWPVRVLDAAKGAGKTYALARVVRPRAVCISDRKALSAQMADRFRGELRREPGSNARAIHRQAQNATRYVATLHTTPRLLGRDVSRDTLVVDEAIHVVRTLANGRELTGRRRKEVNEAFLGLIARSGEVWLAQASWTDDYLHTVARLVAHSGRQERLLVVRVETQEVRGTATEAPSAEDLRAQALDAATRGPVVYACTSRKQGERVRADAVRLGLDPLVVSARTLHQARVQSWISQPSAALEPFVILSPTVVSGLSIDTKPDGTPEYPHVFLEFRYWPGGLTLDDGLQMVARVRGRPSLTWHAPGTPVDVRAPEAIYDEEEGAAVASARLSRAEAPAGCMLDEIAARCRAADAASLAPSPRYALAAGLSGDGWEVRSCEQTSASAEETSRWRDAKEAANNRYIADLAAPERGPVDQQIVDKRLAELGRPSSSGPLVGEALAGVEWLELEHCGRDPLRVLLGMVTPDAARLADRAAHEAGYSRADLPLEAPRVEMLKGALGAANFDLPRLVAGGLVGGVRSTDLPGFISFCRRFEAELMHLFGVRAPRGDRGAVRVLSSLLAQIGAKRAGSQRPGGSKRVREYSFQLSPLAVDYLGRRFEGSVPRPPPASGEIFAGSAEDTLRARVPVRVMPGVVDRVLAVEERAAAAAEPKERDRLLGVIAMLRRAIPAGHPEAPAKPSPRDWLIFSTRFGREGSGRIHLRDEPLQSMPKIVRDLIVPELEEDVFVSADFRSCHVAVAAARSGDEWLRALLDAEGAYEQLAARFLPGVADARARMKQAFLAMQNGAAPARVGQIVGAPQLGQRIHKEVMALLPGLAALIAEAKRLYALPGNTVTVPTLTGEPRTISKSTGSSWRSVLFLMWAGPEAEALDNVLAELPLGARLAAPMHDGLLVSCAKDEAPRVAAELRALMAEAALRAGFRAGVKVGVGRTWAEAETGAR